MGGWGWTLEAYESAFDFHQEKAGGEGGCFFGGDVGMWGCSGFGVIYLNLEEVTPYLFDFVGF